MSYSHKKLQAHDAQRIYACGLYSKKDYKQVVVNDPKLAIKGVRRIIRKSGAVTVVGAPAKSEAKKSANKGPSRKARKSGQLEASKYTIDPITGVMEPVSSGPSNYKRTEDWGRPVRQNVEQ